MARRRSTWERAQELRQQQTQGQPSEQPEGTQAGSQPEEVQLEAFEEGPPEVQLTPVEPAAPSEPPKPTEPHVLFGTKHDQKTIGIAAGVGFALIGIVYGIMSRNEPSFPYMSLFFAALHGGMAFGLIAQLAVVYRDRVVILCTILGILLGEFGFLWGSGGMENFVLDRWMLGLIVGVFFWSGFVGFWAGFILYAKRLARFQRFQGRDKGRSEDA